jgi:hypothetical protein
MVERVMQVAILQACLQEALGTALMVYSQGGMGV